MVFDRAVETQKGDYGRVLIAAGSLGMCGAAVLSARAAYRSGAGVVYVAIPKDFFPVVHCGILEAVLVDRNLTLPRLGDYQALAIGPGMGRGKDTKEFVNFVLTSYKGPLVLDADALNVLAEDNDYLILKNYQGPLILTPHPGEAQRLLHISSGEYKAMSREEVVIALTDMTEAIVVLKGWETLIASPEGGVVVNSTGNPGMATGGTGDVLTGVITALLGRGIKAFGAAVTGVYLHGLAGDIAAKTLGMVSMTAGDLIDSLPKAFMEMEREK